MRRAMVFYGHVASNWGDLAINAGAIELLRHAGIDTAASTAVLLSPSDAFRRRASFTLKDLQTLPVPVDGTLRGGREEVELLTEYIAQPERFASDVGMDGHDVVILNSGEHLFESPNGDNVTDLIWRILPAIAASAIGLPTIQLPATIGPFRTRLGAGIEDFLVEGLSSIAYRESESRRLAGGESDTPVLLDPGFFVPGLKLPADRPEHGSRLGLIIRPEDIGIRPGSRRSSFVQQKLRESEFQDSRAFRLFTELGEGHIADGGRVRIIVQTRADREISMAVATHLEQTCGAESVEFVDPAGFREFIDAVGSLDILATSRFHAVILGLAQGVPCAGVYSETHGHKMPGLFDSLRHPDCAVRLDDRDTGTVSTEVQSALARMTEAAPEVRNRIKANRGLGRRWLTEAVETAAMPDYDTSRLRIDALAALYRTGLRRLEQESLAEVRRSLHDIGRTENS